MKLNIYRSENIWAHGSIFFSLLLHVYFVTRNENSAWKRCYPMRSYFKYKECEKFDATTPSLIFRGHYLALSILSMERRPNKRWCIVLTQSNLCKSIHAVVLIIIHDGINKVTIFITSSDNILGIIHHSLIFKTLNVCARQRLWSEKIHNRAISAVTRGLSFEVSSGGPHTFNRPLRQPRILMIYSQYVARFSRKKQQTYRVFKWFI